MSKDIHKYASAGETLKVQAELENGTEIEIIDVQGMTALYRAVWEGKTEVAKLLVSKNANIHTCSKKQNYLLHAVASGLYKKTDPQIINNYFKIISLILRQERELINKSAPTSYILLKEVKNINGDTALELCKSLAPEHYESMKQVIGKYSYQRPSQLGVFTHSLSNWLNHKVTFFRHASGQLPENKPLLTTGNKIKVQ